MRKQHRLTVVLEAANGASRKKVNKSNETHQGEPNRFRWENQLGKGSTIKVDSCRRGTS